MKLSNKQRAGSLSTVWHYARGNWKRATSIGIAMKIESTPKSQVADHGCAQGTAESYAVDLELLEHGRRILTLRSNGQDLSMEDAKLLALVLDHLRSDSGTADQISELESRMGPMIGSPDAKAKNACLTAYLSDESSSLASAFSLYPPNWPPLSARMPPHHDES